MLNLENIDVTVGKGSKLERLVLQNLSLSVKCGEFVVVIGGNGAGKSTMFNIISGFLNPDSGKVILEGKDITNLSQSSRASFVAKVMQDPRIGTIENMTIFENLAFALRRGESRGFMPFTSQRRTELFQAKLRMLNMGLESRLNELVSNLSGGQRQALSLIMAIITDSKILLLDEITAALDPQIAENVMELTAKIVQEEKRTCIMITHNMNHALKYGDRTLILKDGYFIKEYGLVEKQSLSSEQLASEFGVG